MGGLIAGFQVLYEPMADRDNKAEQKSDPEADIPKLSALFQQMGAEPKQAETMARQLRKRATQVAEEKNISEVEAMEQLLKIAVLGSQGLTEEPNEE